MMNEESLKDWEQDHIELLTSREMGEWLHRRDNRRDNRRDMNARPQGEWIPITYRPMTEEEEKEFCEKLGIEEGSLEDWEKNVFTCHLPDDGQEILTSFFGKYVQEDICVWDEYGCGLENNGDWDGVDAWMPKPEPYKKGAKKNEETY